jgi:hypothetical protein
MTRLAHPLELLSASTLMWALGACGQTNTNEDAGSGGTGGTSMGGDSATGGSGGSDAAGGSATGGSGGSSACGCINRTVRWGHSGGFVAYADTSTISPCTTFEHSRDYRIDSEPPSCTRLLLDCSNGLGISDVVVALNHPDVQAALSAGSVLYGYDDRPVDGTVQSIVVDDAQIEVGAPCDDRVDCTEIPDGVQALVDVLWALTEAQLQQSPCSEVFPE